MMYGVTGVMYMLYCLAPASVRCYWNTKALNFLPENLHRLLEAVNF